MDEVLNDAFAEPDSAHPRRTCAIVVMQHGVVVAERYAAGAGAETPLIGWSMTKSVLNALVGIAVDEPDMASFAADKVLESNPGSRWKYSSGTSLILSRVLREALGDEAYWRFPRTALFAPLGMRHALLQADPSGTFVASSYMYATAREWGRFGQLYLQDGVWRGERILPEGWVEYTRTPAPAAPSTYGAHFWLSTPTEYRWPTVELPAGVFHAVGHEGQFVTLVPSRNVVIVRLGRTRYPNAWAHDRFVSKVLAALPE
jgi:CubicO group peptidase (beta-lactamase class C family)